MKKKLLSLFLALCMILSACVTLGVTTFAAGEALTAQAITDAVTAKTGTININSQDDWDVFAAASKDYTYEGVRIELNTSVTDTAWTGIASFAGTFDGNGNTISGLVISGRGFFNALTSGAEVLDVTFQNCSLTSDTTQTNDYLGLVAGKVTGEIVFDKVITDACVMDSNWGYVGGMIGGVIAGSELTMTNCETKNGSLEGKTGNGMWLAGGFIGCVKSTEDAPSTVSISNCKNGNDIASEFTGYSGSQKAGGFIGNSERYSQLTLTNCDNSGDVSAPCQAAGIIGDARGVATLTDCDNTGAITVGNSNQTGNSFAGGMLAQIIENDGGIWTLTNCTNSGAITANCKRDTSTAGTGYAGGLVGYVEAHTQLTGCVNLESGVVTSYGQVAGGLVGHMQSQNGHKIRNSKNFADVSLEGFGHAKHTNAQGKEVAAAANLAAGGILGRLSVATAAEIISGCENYGDITVQADAASGQTAVEAGGLVGYVAQGATISNSTNRGNVSNVTTIKATCGAGGIVGRSEKTMTFTDCVNYGEIKNSVNHGGGILGYGYNTINFNNVENHGAVACSGYTGGVIGYGGGAVTINGALNTALVTSGSTTGGIVGRMNTSAVTVSQVKNTGAITATNNNAAGIIGYGEGVMTVTNAENEGEITATNNNAAGIVAYSKGAITVTNARNIAEIKSNAGAAGIVAYAAVGATISQAINSAAVTTTGEGAVAAGGILGKASAASTVRNCLNEGTITSAATNVDSGLGGIAGHYRVGSGTFENCISTGSIVGGKEYRAGALLGFVSKSAAHEEVILVKDCYYVDGAVTNSVTGAYDPAIGTAQEKGVGKTNVGVEYTATGYKHTLYGTDTSSASGNWGPVDKLFNEMFNGTNATHKTGAMVASADALQGIAGLKLLSKAGFDVVNTWKMTADGTFVPTALAAGEKKAPDAELAISYKGYQVGTTGTDSEGCIRFIAGMDAIDGYASTGFDMVITTAEETYVPEKPLTTTKVYESLTADGVAGAIKASELDCTYLSALELTGVAELTGIIELTATLTTVDGEVVSGTTVAIVVNAGVVVAQYAI